MKRFLAGFAVVVLAAACMGAQITITIPDDAIANLLVQCEVLRERLSVNPASWGNSACASEFVRLGARAVTNETSVNSAGAAAQVSIETVISGYDADFTVQSGAVCGDGVVDFFDDFNEQCDDSGASASCNFDCTTSVCGDGILNLAAGEQCDDGNTNAGDGCDASCISE